MIYSVVC